ncbi:hypothetical protein F511_07773 [Dorcoceras hygrometricum]|uniref:Uncharacterized protein n=1 Tax=Dorcoceras hygrometricum TaxID=472368 RepID=A0A2Z7D0I1_9LAMI|nr:hypothetical protein F511_07773 [Dorcoceras hygrometricum]
MGVHSALYSQLSSRRSTQLTTVNPAHNGQSTVPTTAYSAHYSLQSPLQLMALHLMMPNTTFGAHYSLWCPLQIAVVTSACGGHFSSWLSLQLAGDNSAYEGQITLRPSTQIEGEEVENTRNAASFSSKNYELVGEEGRKRERRNYRKETRVLLCYDKYSEVLVMKNKREMENKRYQSDQSDKMWMKLTTLDVETISDKSQDGQGKTSSAHSGTLVEDKPAKLRIRSRKAAQRTETRSGTQLSKE